LAGSALVHAQKEGADHVFMYEPESK